MSVLCRFLFSDTPSDLILFCCPINRTANPAPALCPFMGMGLFFSPTSGGNSPAIFCSPVLGKVHHRSRFGPAGTKARPGHVPRPLLISRIGQRVSLCGQDTDHYRPLDRSGASQEGCGIPGTLPNLQTIHDLYYLAGVERELPELLMTAASSPIS